MEQLKCLALGIPLEANLPEAKSRDYSVPHAPARNTGLNQDEEMLALQNSLRYFPEKYHKVLAGEFARELHEYGHIYMYRFRPDFEMRAYPIDYYPAKTKQGASIMLMIMNNLDPQVAQFPHELVTYGGNGQVFSNWAQFWLTMKYLSEIGNEQTLVMYSGHPLGLFPSPPSGPRVVITNGMVIPNYSSRQHYDQLFALGVTQYGQMTAGSYCYIGPQGIVHGTTLTLLNAGKKYLKTSDLRGKVYVSSGLGGMSGAQAKAATICQCVGVTAEVSRAALEKMLSHGWLLEAFSNLDDVVSRIKQARQSGHATSIGYHGNIVDLWERLAAEYEATGERLVDLGSDQTACHNPFNGGYYPVQLTFEEANNLMVKDPSKFKRLIQESLRRQVNAINKLCVGGMFFWDYGNAFLLEAERAGAEVLKSGNTFGTTKYRYPSYVQDIMGEIFSLGFGPYRWVCTSSDHEDLRRSDAIAEKVLQEIISEGNVTESVLEQYKHSLYWIREAKHHKLVVGSQARILYMDQPGRIRISVAFNNAVRNGQLKGPVVISRDHHDVGGTDSPYRETSNIFDGSQFTADMAVHNCIGNAFRGATWVALHNGGGVGWGEVINGGLGLVLDGTEEATNRAEMMLGWDVSNGVTRRCWSGNASAEETIRRTMQQNPKLNVTMPYKVTDINILRNALK